MPRKADCPRLQFRMVKFCATCKSGRIFPTRLSRDRYAPGISEGEGGEPCSFGVIVSANSFPPSCLYVTLILSPGLRFSAPFVMFVNKTVSVPLSVLSRIRFCSRSIFCTVPSNTNAEAVDACKKNRKNHAANFFIKFFAANPVRPSFHAPIIARTKPEHGRRRVYRVPVPRKVVAIARPRAAL